MFKNNNEDIIDWNKFSEGDNKSETVLDEINFEEIRFDPIPPSSDNSEKSEAELFAEAEEIDFEPIQSGSYPAKIENVELEDTSWGVTQISISIKLEDGRRDWFNLPIKGKELSPSKIKMTYIHGKNMFFNLTGEKMIISGEEINNTFFKKLEQLKGKNVIYNVDFEMKKDLQAKFINTIKGTNLEADFMNNKKENFWKRQSFKKIN